MTVIPALSPTLRRASRWLAALAALGVLGFSIAASLMYFWVLPNIADHRDTVAGLMSRALGQRVTLEAVSGVWQQARPEFRLQGVRLHDAQGRAALYLPELKAAFAWRSLLFLEPRFNRIELQGLALGVRRAPDGHFYVGGIPVNPADPDSGFASWLLRQGRVQVSGATLTWRDEVRDAPPLVLSEVDFTLDNTRTIHHMTMRAVPPASLARPLTAEAKLTSHDVQDPATWAGTVHLAVAGVAFPVLTDWLALPHQPQRGSGALRVQFDVAAGKLAAANVGFELRSIETVLGEGLPPLRLAQARGNARWTRDADGQRVAFENLRLAPPGAALGDPFNAGFYWDAHAHEITAQAFRLGAWQTMLPSLPMDAALRTRLQAMQPQGRVDSLRLRWTGAQPGLDNFEVAAHVSGLGIAASDGLPGVANLTGRIEGDARAGVFEIDAARLGLSLPEWFREPSFAFDRLQTRGSWKKSARGHRLTLDTLDFSNADMTAEIKGHYELIADQPGVADLEARLSHIDGTAAHHYFPRVIGDSTYNWIKRGVLAGHTNAARMTLKGDLAKFPFEQGEGVFRFEAQIKAGVIDYIAGWPRIEDIEANLLFHGKEMELTATQARIYGVALAPVKASIPDLLHHEEDLYIDGQANGPIQDFIRFTNSSPVGARLRGFTDTLDGTGPMRLALKLHVPLRHSHDTTLGGRVSFLDNTLFPPGLPRIDQARGDIDFTGDGVTARNLVAQFLGGPLRVDAATRNGDVQILAQGRATAAGLTPWIGPAWGKRLTGQTNWRGRIDLLASSARLRVESDLVGLGSSLPAPLAKAAAQPMPLRVVREPDGAQQRVEVHLDQTVSAVWRSSAAGDFERGEIRFGAPATLPAEPGLRLAGSGRALDVSGWLALLPEGNGAQTGLTLTAVDLGFETLDLMERRYQELRVQGRSRNGILRTRVTGQGIDGVLTHRPAGEQTARISAQFSVLTIPERAQVEGAADTSHTTLRAERFPRMDLSVEDFRLQARPMGRLDVVAHGAPQGLVIDSLQLTHPDSVFRMSGLWRAGVQSETRAELNLSVVDAGRFLARFDYPDAVRRGSVEIHGNASWVGSPADFAFDTLAGQLDFKAKSGQFLKINPGAGKLLGVLSLQSLPRRLNFDFRDIFNEGYAFDDISATLRAARGVVYSDDFRMRGPAAKVNMSGLADLNQESVQLRVKVIPKLSEGVAVAGALIGGPLAGLGALAAQKLLRDPFEEAISREYMVTGAWQAPDVRKLTKPDTPVSEP
ncbi:MAG: YhdP family protein [Thiobacillus sp.]|nr:YhdP family protein [Thiobacillus sp.]